MKYMNTEYKKNCPKGLTYEISGISFFCKEGNAEEEMQYFSILLYLSSKFPVNIDSWLSLCSPQPPADEEDRDGAPRLG